VEAAPPHVEPVDTVGAGDAFAGALVVALAEGRPLESALDFANMAGALATLRPGAQEAIPRRGEIEAGLHQGPFIERPH
jgi:ribokinase